MVSQATKETVAKLKDLAGDIDDVDNRVDRLDYRVEGLEGALETLADEILDLKRDAQRREIIYMPSSVFAATFSDGTAVRMSTFCPNGLDLGRGARLAIAAYQSRRKQDPPAMVSAQFEVPVTGEVLRVYAASELIGAEKLPRMTFEKGVRS